ncbi:hypothetical protein [Flavobacterium sp. GT3R68]|uniref:hypothetical protein n=1 Tax=Flavobacterium sp. GT3R68 TaxID=2594437 RepID=UPI000F85EF0A|nr:hypothetical protein [Flavobacterium sp. GT3R68]RTY86201.1 hypothetical protein EKL32_27950 [Flavobacterium sp. GSN2]TRW94019.1 hypothetical protein FNW07_03655 [Flavobacterium sp. GT3R68]
MVIPNNEAQNTAENIAKSVCNENLINLSTSSSFLISPLIYVTDGSTVDGFTIDPVNTGVVGQYDSEIPDEIQVSYPLFFPNVSTILIPKKVQRNLGRIPKKYLENIDNDKTIAIEKCLVIVSNLSSTMFDDNRWKSLSSTLMHEQTKKGNDNTFIYPHIIKALKYSTNNTEGIIKVKENEFGNETYQEGVSSKEYGLTDTYYKTRLVEYNIKNKEILHKRNKFFYSLVKKAKENVIANNLIDLYAKIDLPNYNDLVMEAKKLVKAKYKSKKGKTLTFLNKHSESYFKDVSSRSFVENNIKQFDYLTQRSFMVPIVGDEKSGGRVVDSFTLMPSWIRKLVKIDGERIVEVDYKALHPNIAISIYGGSKKYLTHDIVAEGINLDISDVKIQHLSYFNKRVQGMKRSALYDFYNESEPLMNETIMREKQTSLKAHRITSMRMFAKEVEIMTECIKQLNSRGIYVGYVYDALFCKESDVEIVEQIMNKVVLEFNVYTTAH